MIDDSFIRLIDSIHSFDFIHLRISHGMTFPNLNPILVSTVASYYGTGIVVCWSFAYCVYCTANGRRKAKHRFRTGGARRDHPITPLFSEKLYGLGSSTDSTDSTHSTKFFCISLWRHLQSSTRLTLSPSNGMVSSSCAESKWMMSRIIE